MSDEKMRNGGRVRRFYRQHRSKILVWFGVVELVMLLLWRERINNHLRRIEYLERQRRRS